MDKISLRKSIQLNIEKLLMKERGYIFRMPKPSEGIVFIFSGGIDSTIALARLSAETDSRIYPLYVRRGARAEKSELAAVRYYTTLFKNRHSNLQPLKIIDASVPPTDLKKDIPSKRLRTHGHPMRNAVLQSIGVQYAVAITSRKKQLVRTVMTATSPNDHFSHNSLGAARAMTLMACIDSDDWTWQVTSPLIEPAIWGVVNKSDAIKYAQENNIPLDRTFSCTQQSKTQCGVCPECDTRRQAFYDANVVDPVGYDVEAI